MEPERGDKARPAFMMPADYDSMPLDELWAFREELAMGLAEKDALEVRLNRLLGALKGLKQSRTARPRPYPLVIPKYRNPDDPLENWSSRGEQPRWLVALLQTDKQIGDLTNCSESRGRLSNGSGLKSRKAGNLTRLVT